MAWPFACLHQANELLQQFLEQHPNELTKQQLLDGIIRHNKMALWCFMIFMELQECKNWPKIVAKQHSNVNAAFFLCLVPQCVLCVHQIIYQIFQHQIPRIGESYQKRWGPQVSGAESRLSLVSEMSPKCLRVSICQYDGLDFCLHMSIHKHRYHAQCRILYTLFKYGAAHIVHLIWHVRTKLNMLWYTMIYDISWVCIYGSRSRGPCNGFRIAKAARVPTWDSAKFFWVRERIFFWQTI